MNTVSSTGFSDLLTISMASLVGWIAFFTLGMLAGFLAFFFVLSITYNSTSSHNRQIAERLKQYGYIISSKQAELVSLRFVNVNATLIGVIYGWSVGTTIGGRLWS